MSARIWALFRGLLRIPIRTKLLSAGQARARTKAEMKVRVYRAAEDRWYDVKVR